MAKSKKLNIKTLIVLVLALLIIGSCFLQWMLYSYEAPIVGKTSGTFYGSDFLNVMFNGKDAVSLKDTEASLIYGWTQMDDYSGLTTLIMISLAGTLIVGAVMAVSSLLGLMKTKKLFVKINTLSSLLLVVLGILGTIGSMLLVNKAFKPDLGILGEAIQITTMSVAPMIVLVLGIAALVLSLLTKTKKK